MQQSFYVIQVMYQFQNIARNKQTKNNFQKCLICLLPKCQKVMIKLCQQCKHDCNKNLK